MSHIVVVQQICTRWYKSSRGGKNARKRNAVPEAAELPLQRVEKAGLELLHHSLYFPESTGFTKHFEKITVNSTLRPLEFGCVTVDPGAETVQATFRYNRKCGGAPDRGWTRKTFLVAVDEWARIAYNGRFSPAWEGDWWYEKTVVNVGLFSRLTPDIFICGDPTYRFAAMGHLF